LAVSTGLLLNKYLLLQPSGEMKSTLVSPVLDAKDTEVLLVPSVESALHHFLGARRLFPAGIRLLLAGNFSFFLAVIIVCHFNELNTSYKRVSRSGRN